jgi:opacity protein-like surface antigen
MIRALCISAVLLLSALYASAQADSAVAVPSRKASHYFGIQANQLFRQLLNLGGNNTSAINNPYLISYAVNSNRTGWGFALGIGYTYSQATDGETTNKRETTVDNFSLRMGVERKYTLGKRWLTGWGFDVIYDATKNDVKNTTGFDPTNRSVIETIDKANGPGFGPRFILGFKVSDKIYVGTEANYYYKKLSQSHEEKTSLTAPTIDPITGRQITVTTNSSTKTEGDQKNFQLNVPAVLFVILKL